MAEANELKSKLEGIDLVVEARVERKVTAQLASRTFQRHLVRTTA